MKARAPFVQPEDPDWLGPATKYVFAKGSGGTNRSMNDDVPLEWEKYLSNLFAAPGINPTASCDLLQDKERLFVRDPTNALLETWSYTKNTGFLEKASARPEEDLTEYLDVSRDESIARQSFAYIVYLS